MTNYKVIKRESKFDKFIKIDELTLDTGRELITRFIVQRPNSSATLLYHSQNDSFVFVRQFRAPLITKGDDPNILEIVAGNVEENEDPKQTAIRETMEETGYRISNPQFIAEIYASPGFLDEKIFIFYAEIQSSDKISAGGGNEEETENIIVEEFSREEVISLMKGGKIMDGKTLLALNWWFRRNSA